jgi:hypothetical protein
MEESILTSTKKTLGLVEEDPTFDLDIMTHINSAFSDLFDLGIGPVEGFAIVDESTVWDAFSDDVTTLSRVKTFIYLKVRLLFDPPTTSFTIKAFEDQIKEAVWRMSVHREGSEWADPDPPVLVGDE